MHSSDLPSRFWINWLLLASLGVLVFGLVLVLAPALTRQGFSLLVYSSAGHIDAFGLEPARYIALAHAVLGSVMVGWGMALLYVTRSLVSRGYRAGWNVVTFSLLAWFVPDALYSVLSGFWQNAVLNLGFAVLFALPLWALRGAMRETD